MKKKNKPDKHLCVMCEKMFKESDIEFSPDPFNAEINDDHTPVWECYDCRCLSCEEI